MDDTLKLMMKMIGRRVCQRRADGKASVMMWNRHSIYQALDEDTNVQILL